MIDDHHVELNRLRAGLVKAMTVAEVYQTMVKRALTLMQLILASGEVLACRHYLVHSNEVGVMFDDDGLTRYQLICVQTHRIFFDFGFATANQTFSIYS